MLKNGCVENYGIGYLYNCECCSGDPGADGIHKRRGGNLLGKEQRPLHGGNAGKDHEGSGGAVPPADGGSKPECILEIRKHSCKRVFFYMPDAGGLENGGRTAADFRREIKCRVTAS